jgi:hypothetical protein
LNIDETPIASTSHTHPSHSQTSLLLTSSLFLSPSPPRNPVYTRRTDPSVSVFSLSLHRHPYIYIPSGVSLYLLIINKQLIIYICVPVTSRFIYYNKHTKTLSICFRHSVFFSVPRI